MKTRRFYAMVAIVALLGVATTRVVADDAARGWSDSKGFRSTSEQSVLFNKAQAEHLMRKGIVPGSTIVTNVRNCTVAGACQDGTNINGYTSTTITGSRHTTVRVQTETDRTTQTNETTPVVAEDIGTLTID